MKFGILCNSNYLQKWQLETISHLVSGGHSCALLIVNGNPAPVKRPLEKIIRYPYSNLLIRFWFRYVIRPESKTMVDLTFVLPYTPGITCLTSKKGYADYFASEDIATIKSNNLDFILRFGFGIIKGEILEAAKYGVWSYHHDDDRKYRGVPTGFWEIYYNDPVNAAILQRLTNQIDSGVILRKAYFATIQHSWQANLDNLLRSSTEWPLQVCRDIENGNSDFLSLRNSPQSPIFKLPNNLKMLRFLLKVAANKLMFHYRDLFFTEKWNVGIVPAPAKSFVKEGEFIIPKPIWLKLNTKKSVYHADSFGFVRDKEFHIICEEYDYTDAKGFLTSFSVNSHTFISHSIKKALEKKYHLAYPFLFESGGEYYCVPENSEAKCINLYRYNMSDDELVFDKTLLQNVQAVDPTIIFHDGYWWLFFTDRISTNERLHIWYSESLKGEYTPHANNPVKVDIRSSRPAGNLFELDGKLFRPAQDCSIRSGRRICINEVLQLTPVAFQEKEYCILSPDPGSEFADGMHTFCVTDGAVIIDGKRERFIWQAFLRKISIKINKLLKISKW
jgi:hypothetical protein